MILRLFKSSQPISWLIFISVVLISRLIAFTFYVDLSPTPIAISDQWGFLEQLAIEFPWISNILGSLAIIISAAIYNQISHKIQIISDLNTYMAIIFSLVLSLSPSNLWLNPFLISLPVLIFSISILGNQPKNTLYLKSTFNSALLAGVAAVIYPPNGLFLIVSAIIITILFPAKWRHYALQIIGFYTAPFFFESISYLVDFTPSVEPLLLTIGDSSILGTNFMVIITTIGLSIIGLPTYFKGYAHKAVRARKLYNIHIIWLILSGLAFFIFNDYNQSIVGFVAFPLSVVWAAGQQVTRKWWISDLFMLTLIGAIVFNYYHVWQQLIPA